MTSKCSEDQLREIARRVRHRVLLMTNRARSSHVGSSFSMVELLVALYFRILNIRPEAPAFDLRDRFVLSKGHACAALYAVLSERGFFPEAWLDDFYIDGARLAGHVTHRGVPGIEVSTGSLGHGLSLASGMALAAKRDDATHRVFCLLSDGECDEGSTWEAALFGGHNQLDNLVAIVDYNKIQSLGTVKDVLDLEPFRDKWRSFGWSSCEIDGHDFSSIERAIAHVPLSVGRPTCVIAHTVKGKGVSFMENQVLWHYRSPAGEELRLAIEEITGGR